MYNSNNTGLGMDGLRYLGIIALSAAAPTTLTLANTYYKLLGVFTDTGNDTKFTPNVDGSTIYNGEAGILKVVGTSDVSINNPSLLTYALFINDILVPISETPHDFDAANKSENLSIVGVFGINPGDKIQVWAKSNGVGDIVTPKNLNVVFDKK